MPHEGRLKVTGERLKAKGERRKAKGERRLATSTLEITQRKKVGNVGKFFVGFFLALTNMV